MSKGTEESCAICCNEPQDMLIMSCGHNLCLDCATQIHALSTLDTRLNCQICATFTNLDAQTVQCLINLHNKPNKQHFPPHPVKQTVKLIDSSSQILFKCQQHHEEVLYYCFKCKTHQICSECILTEQHKGHEVQTIKKAQKKIILDIKEHIKRVEKQSKELKQQEQIFVNQNDHFKKVQEDKLQQLKQLFDECIYQITDRYQALVKQLQSTRKRRIEIFQGGARLCKERIREYQNIIEYSRQLIQNANIKEILNHTHQIDMKNIAPSSLLSSSLQPITEKDLQLNSTPRQIIFMLHEWLKSIEWRKLEPEVDIIQLNRCSVIANESVNNSQNSDSGHNFSMACSRKSQLTKSIDNATNIINKLQQRTHKRNVV